MKCLPMVTVRGTAWIRWAIGFALLVGVLVSVGSWVQAYSHEKLEKQREHALKVKARALEAKHKAEAAIASAEGALEAASSEGKPGIASRARELIEENRKKLADANLEVKKAQLWLDAVDTLLAAQSGIKGRVLAVPLARGEVRLRTDIFDPKGILWQNRVLQPGDTIETGFNGFVALRFPNGSTVILGPVSEFAARAYGDTTIFYLLKGRLHFSTEEIGGVFPMLEIEPPFRFGTGSVRGTVRGTKFDLLVDDSRLTHIVPYAGKIELTADSEKLDRSKINRWWEMGQVKGRKSVLPGETLRTGPGEVVRVELQGGFIGTLGANSTLQVAEKQNSKGLIYALWSGTLYLVRGAKVAGLQTPTFITANAALNVGGTELEVAVDQNGITKITPYSGKIEIDARMEQLDQSKVNRWWDESYRQ